MNNGFIIKFEQDVFDGMDQRVEVSARQICSPDRLVEESVPSEDVAVSGEADTPGRVAWSV